MENTRSAPETTIDRSFDQTAVHIHDGRYTCPTCGIVREAGANGEHLGVNPRPFGRIGKPISPAILEFRAQQQETEIRRLAGALATVTAERDKAVYVISLFEDLVKGLAGRVDQMQAIIDGRETIADNQPTELKAA